MTRSNSFIRAAMFVAALAVAGTACTASTTVASTTAANTAPTTSTTIDQDAAPIETAVADSAAAETPTTSAPAPTEPATAEVPDAGQQTVEVVFDDGRSWTLQATDCMSNPGQGQALLINAMGEGTLEFGAVITRPLAELANEDAEQLFIATFIDDQDQLYVFEDPEGIDTAADGSISFTAKLHTNIFYQLGDQPAAIGTFSC